MNQFIHPVRTTHDGIEIVATVYRKYLPKSQRVSDAKGKRHIQRPRVTA